MKLLLSGNMQIIKNYVKEGSVIGFIPTASEVEDDRSYMVQNKIALEDMGYNISVIELTDDSREKIIAKLKNTDVLFVSGSNCFYLLQQIKQKSIMENIVDFAENKIYIGISAGSCIASPNIEYVKNLDDPKYAPLLENCDALNFIDSHILPHYNNSDEYNALIDKMTEEYPGLKFITLTDKQCVIVNDKNDYKIVETD